MVINLLIYHCGEASLLSYRDYHYAQNYEYNYYKKKRSIAVVIVSIASRRGESL
jgi:hypothetical protein